MNTNNTAYQYTLFTVKGDSMDNGKRNSFEDGDTVCTEQVETSGLAQAIQDAPGGYWVIATDKGTLLRQAVSCDHQCGIHLKALNPGYEDIFIPLEEVKAAYRVVKLQPKTVYYN